MAHFPTPPSLQPLGNGAWRLPEDYEFPVARLWTTVPGGFLTDLASVPRWLTPFIQRDELGGAAPVIHDFLYQTGGAGLEPPLKPALSRRQVDALFRMFMRLEEVPAWRRGVAWGAVRLAGWACWHANKSSRQEAARGPHRPPG